MGHDGRLLTAIAHHVIHPAAIGFPARPGQEEKNGGGRGGEAPDRQAPGTPRALLELEDLRHFAPALRTTGQVHLRPLPLQRGQSAIEVFGNHQVVHVFSAGHVEAFTLHLPKR